MPSLLKWLLFTILTLAYIWAVFLWDKGPKIVAEPSNFEANFENANALFEQEANGSDAEITDYEQPESDSVNQDAEFEIEVKEQTITTSYEYYVISGSYREESQAIIAKDQYAKLGIEAEVIKIAPLYKVVIAKAIDIDQAKEYVKEFDLKGIPSFYQKI